MRLMKISPTLLVCTLTLSMLALYPLDSWGQSAGSSAPTKPTDKDAVPLNLVERVPESTRRKIYESYFLRRIATQIQAEMMVKRDRDSVTSAETTKKVEDTRKSLDALQELTMLHRYQISASELAAIVQEGTLKNWPKPVVKKNQTSVTPATPTTTTTPPAAPAHP